VAHVILGVPPRPGLRIMVAAKPIDFRKGMDSLAALVKQALASDPFTGDVFIFRSKRSDRLKLLLWDGSGLCLVTKRLESGAFTWPAVRDWPRGVGAVRLAVRNQITVVGHQIRRLGGSTYARSIQPLAWAAHTP
jgi:hypothetical protein